MEIEGGTGPLIPVATEVFEDRELASALSLAERSSDGSVPIRLGRAEVSASGKGGLTPLAWAVLRRSSSAIAYLLREGAEGTSVAWDGAARTPLHVASALESAQPLIAALVNGGVEVDVLDPAGYETPLLTSIMTGRIESLRTLVALGADVNRLDRVDNSPLHIAGGVADAEAVLALLDAGADPDRRNRIGVTFRAYFFMTPDRVLTQAARDGRVRVSEWLSSHGYAVAEA